MTDIFDHPMLGGLFADAEATTIWSADRQLVHMLAFEAAFSRALGAVGRQPAEMAEAAAQVIKTFTPDLQALRDGTARDGLPVPALVKQLRQAAGVNAPAVHSGTTSQDVMDTALALALRETCDLLDRRLAGLQSALSGLSDRFGAAPLMGRTRMQAALPITVADRIASWALPLETHRERLALLRPRLILLQLGGAAGDRAEMQPQADAMAAHMAKTLGLGNPERAWHTTRDSIVEFAGFLSLVAGGLGKMGQDICLMAQQGIDEIALSGGGGSSAMPHKQNPILAELLVTLAQFNATQLGGMHHTLVHEQERSGSAWALEWMLLPQMALATARSLGAADALCNQITVIGKVD